MRQCGIDGQKWLRQFAHGFPITGELSQRYAYRVNAKHCLSMLPRASLASTSPARFKERAAKSGYADAQVLWGEAQEQVGKGWLAPPVLLDESGGPRGWRPPQLQRRFSLWSPAGFQAACVR